MPPCDLAIVFTDSNATREAAATASAALKPDGFAMTLQNGIGNVEVLVEVLGKERVVAGVTMNSGAHPQPGLSVYTNADMTTIGELDGSRSERIVAVADMLNAAQIETEVVSDPMSYVYGKFVLNCGVNAIAAVTGLRSGEVYRTPELRALQGHMMDEVMRVVEAKGWKLSEADPRAKILHHSKLRFNKPSMLQHVEQGRRTEIDAINGALVREAHALGLAVPYNEAVVAIVKGVEKSRHQLLDGKGQIVGEFGAQAEQTGLVILGMGKYGAGELNYSSDIDLVVFYEPDQLALRDGLEPSEFFVRLTRDLVKIIQERTEDGYVFRVDLRLRPDPGGTAVAVSLPAAEEYYESRGQNWERAAFIKARPVAGPPRAAEPLTCSSATASTPPVSCMACNALVHRFMTIW
jgi:2-dehydropantoate 2-reductase